MRATARPGRTIRLRPLDHSIQLACVPNATTGPLRRSATTLLGLAKHLVGVKCNWFQLIVAAAWTTSDRTTGDDASGLLTDEATIESMLAEHAPACTESRRVAVRYKLTDVVPLGCDRQRKSLRMRASEHELITLVETLQWAAIRPRPRLLARTGTTASWSATPAIA
jgi:hypothetical protein